MSVENAPVTELQSKKTPEDGFLGKINTILNRRQQIPSEDAGADTAEDSPLPPSVTDSAPKMETQASQITAQMLFKFVFFFNFQKVSKSSNLLRY